VSKADEALRLGIARKVQPLKRLQTHYDAFKTRTSDPEYVAPSLLNQIEAQAQRSQQPAGAPVAANGRAVLGVRQSAPTPRSQQQQRTASSSIKNNGAKLDIFSDENGSAGQGGVETQGEWKDFGTRSANRKENTLEAVGWKGEVLHQKGLAVGVTKSEKMEVFSDDVGQ
jgi:hypothetical protein